MFDIPSKVSELPGPGHYNPDLSSVLPSSPSYGFGKGPSTSDLPLMTSVYSIHLNPKNVESPKIQHKDIERIYYNRPERHRNTLIHKETEPIEKTNYVKSSEIERTIDNEKNEKVVNDETTVPNQSTSCTKSSSILQQVEHEIAMKSNPVWAACRQHCSALTSLRCAWTSPMAESESSRKSIWNIIKTNSTKSKKVSKKKDPRDGLLSVRGKTPAIHSEPVQSLMNRAKHLMKQDRTIQPDDITQETFVRRDKLNYKSHTRSVRSGMYLP
eukprot:NODE_4888_length_1098_cov_66.684103_g4341_i0.p1 GENE.NODE_4888_length_1098_cov_66.684103_g4341_i0~~NODE_4888_length_1098_cov_66.684103_g4341_i0.p1  ORF type:complete len:270 (-),score=35.59 NODE_4888_length_1098_cov_66.684103_g4341_i0:98-907(-)